MPRALFIQYLNPEISRLYGLEPEPTREEYRQLLLVTKYGVLIGRERMIVPGSYLFEVPWIDRFFRNIAPLLRAGLMYVASPSCKFAEYSERKREEYRDDAPLAARYSNSEISATRLRWMPRFKRSASQDITTIWRRELAAGGLWEEILGSQRQTLQGLERLERQIDLVPNRLEGRAFVSRFATPLLPFAPSVRNRARIDMMLSRAYLESYLEELDAFIMVDTPLGIFDCDVPRLSADRVLRTVSMRNFSDALDWLGVRVLFEKKITWTQLLVLRTKAAVSWTVDTLIDGDRAALNELRLCASTLAIPPPIKGQTAVEEIDTRLSRIRRTMQASGDPGARFIRNREIYQPVIQNNLFEDNQEQRMDTNTVFVVHGRDTTTLSSLKTLLRAAGLKPLDWEDVVSWTGSSSPTTLEVVRRGISQSQAVLILVTPDEHAELRSDLRRSPMESEGGFQPRPNVLVEIGMAVAMNPERTILLRIGSVRPVSDIAGINFLSFDGSAPARNALADRFRVAGCTPKPTTEFFSMPFSVPGAPAK
jgi:predicted nucleotide-binding protein